jgi:uncharacterized protein (TIGR03437 family)
MWKNGGGKRGTRLAGFALLVVCRLAAADFQSGQAARAVIGQATFSSRDAGIAAQALTIARGRLYAADAAHRVLTFDLSKIPAVKEDPVGREGPACGVCGFVPAATASQSVVPGVAAWAAFGKAVVFADTANRRILIWRGTGAGDPQKPDVVLTRTGLPLSSASGGAFTEPVAVAYDGRHLFVGDTGLQRVLIWNGLPESSDQPADALLGQGSGASGEVTAATLHGPAALASDGTNLFVADSVDRRILVFSPGDTNLSPDAAVNSASSLAMPFAPGTLVTVRGTFELAAPVTRPESPSPVTKLAGVEVVLDGVAAPLLSVSSEQAEVQIPYDLGGATAGSLYVRIERADGTVSVSNAIGVRFAATSPGIYAFGGAEPREGMLLKASSVDTRAGAPVTVGNPAKAGDLVTVWATGLGAVKAESGNAPAAGAPATSFAEVAAPVSVRVNGEPAEVVSARLPADAIGVYEVQLRLPAGLATRSAAMLSIGQDGNTSNTVTFPIDNEQL